MKAIIFIDVQNDFIDGVLGVDKDHEISDRIVKYANTSSYWYNTEAPLTIATRDTHFKNLYMSSLEGQKLPVPHCIANTEGWNLYANLAEDMDYIVNKPTFGSKHLITLIEEINNRWLSPIPYRETATVRTPSEIDEIEICGFCTSICVISNALMLRAAFPNMKITLLENLCGDIDKESHEAAVRVMKNCQIDVKTV